MNLPPKLNKIRNRTEEIARIYGLDFFETRFHMLNFKQINEIASYGGFPTRYPHWKFGMEYERMEKSYKYGLHRIYEMVINNNPCHAYLLDSNLFVDQKLVIAHVFGHCDFFKNNLCFSKTNRNMLNEMANHGTRIRKYIEIYGLDRVESFIDTCLSIEDLIDHHSVFIVRKKDIPPSPKEGLLTEEAVRQTEEVKKLVSKGYMDKFINPESFMEEMKKQLGEKKEQEKKFPEHPEKDILLFLMQYAPLEKWELDILSIIREESYYFAPQRQTKIMNEGWASYWHSTIMTQKMLNDSEVIDYADHHSGTMGQSPGSLNPYKLGLELLKDIEDRWNKGRFGKDYDDCDDIAVKKNWDTKLGKGREKIFEVRKFCSDITFIDHYLTKEFCEEHKMFTYKHNKDRKVYEIADRDFQKIKQKLLFSLTNFGKPFICVEDLNYNNRSELYLSQRHDGIDMDVEYSKDTIKNIQKIWKRPVNLETTLKGKKKIFSFDGKTHTERDL